MNLKVFMLCLIVCFALSSQSFAQKRFDQLDPEPYKPGVDADIDMFMNNWINSTPIHTHGSLIERDILSRCEGDPLDPVRKGAVLKYINRYCHATLDAYYSTTLTTLEGEQEILYILSGKGLIKAGSKTADLYEGICALVPANLEFVMTNTGDDPLTMLLLCEPIPEGFLVNEEIIVEDANTAPYTSHEVHWVMNIKDLFGVADGLGTLEGVAIIDFDPLTMAQPHSHVEGCEEVWTALDKNSVVLLGKQLRNQPPGTAFKIPPNGKTPHATINVTDKKIRFFFWARFGDHEVRK